MFWGFFYIIPYYIPNVGTVKSKLLFYLDTVNSRQAAHSSIIWPDLVKNISSGFIFLTFVNILLSNFLLVNKIIFGD